jgi:hypothetical protein
MRNAIPIICGITIGVVVAGVKMTHPTEKLESIVWYGNAVHPYITEVRAGVEAFAKDSGVPVYCTIGQEWTQDNQNVNVEALSTTGYKAFCLFPGDAVGANALFQLLRDHGQNVVAYGAQPALPTPIPFTVGTNIKGAAMDATEELIRLMGGHGKILNLLEASTDVNTRARDEGIREVVARHPGVEIIQTLSDMIKMGEAGPCPYAFCGGLSFSKLPRKGIGDVRQTFRCATHRAHGATRGSGGFDCLSAFRRRQLYHRLGLRPRWWIHSSTLNNHETHSLWSFGAGKMRRHPVERKSSRCLPGIRRL